MSRIGKQPISLPAGVQIEQTDGNVTVKGPKGSLSAKLLKKTNLEVAADTVKVNRDDDDKYSRSNHGLQRSLLYNMVIGVSQGYKKTLELNGVGYRVAVAGNVLKLKVGLSHEIEYKIPEGITVTTDQNKIVVEGIDKQLVGQVAAEIRSVKKPEPYKGKGIKYDDERILRKSGKSGKE